MTRFLVNCEFESHVSLADESELLRYAHPKGVYEVFVRNLQVEEGSDPPLLSVQLVFEADDLANAKEVASKFLREVSDYIAFVTTAKCKVHRILQIFNWEASAPSGMREAMYYEGFKNHDIPLPAMSSEVIETVALLQAHEVPARLKRAIRWFSDGVASQYQDDQFINFWLVVEVLAQLTKNPAPIPDRCPKCRSPLYCDVCNASHLHKPYPKQAISQLFESHVNGDWEVLFLRAEKSRNMLMHGEDIKAIERELTIAFPPLVEAMARLARVAILNQFLPELKGKELRLLTTNRVIHLSLTVGAHVAIGFAPNFNDPHPKHFPKLEISRVPRPN